MKLSNTKISKSNSLVALTEDISIKMLPMKQMLELFSAIGSEETEDQAAAIDEIFDTVIVDSKGNKFDDLKEGTATEVLPMPIIMDIMTLVSEKLNPAGKK